MQSNIGRARQAGQSRHGKTIQGTHGKVISQGKAGRPRKAGRQAGRARKLDGARQAGTQAGQGE
jgi:hypothetical protein